MLMERPLPNPTEDSEAYWEAAKAGKLVVSGCTACGHKFLPPARMCPKCWSLDVSWVEVSGRAKLWSFIIVHRPQHPGFQNDVPYNVAIVELEEGIRMHTNVVECANDALRIGMPVEVVFEKVDEEITLPKFRPRGGP